MHTLAVITVLLMALLGVLLTVFTLPGAWIALIGALVVNIFWIPGMFSWWTIGVCVALATAGEIIELVSGGIGASSRGGSRWGIVAGTIGSIAGALAGTILIPIPIAGTIIGAVAGAGLGALAAERHIAKRTWSDSYAIGAGAAVGRLWAIVVKTALAIVIALVLCVAAFV